MRAIRCKMLLLLLTLQLQLHPTRTMMIVMIMTVCQSTDCSNRLISIVYTLNVVMNDQYIDTVSIK